MFPNLFPWSDAAGLCPALDDANIWSYCFSKKYIGDSAKHAREDVKRVGKKRYGRPGIPHSVRIDDDRQFGAYIVALLKDQFARKRLLAELDKHVLVNARTMLAQGVYNYVQVTFEEGKNIDLTLVCESREVQHKGGPTERLFIVPDRMPAWLSTYDRITPELVRLLSTVACAFAILQPDEAARIYESMVSWNISAEEWLGNTNHLNPLSSKTVSCQSDDVLDATSSEESVHSAVKSASNATVGENHFVGLHQLSGIRDTLQNIFSIDTVPIQMVEKVKQAVADISKTLQELNNHISEKASGLLDSQEKLTARLEVLLNHPLLAGVALHPLVHAPPAESSLGDAIKVVEDAERSIAAIEEFLNRHDELAVRLGKNEILGIQISNSPRLAEIAESIEQRALALDSELLDRESRIRTRDSLFESIRRAHSADRPRVLQDFPVDKLLAAARSLAVDHGIPESFDKGQRLRTIVLIVKYLYSREQRDHAIELLNSALSCYSTTSVADLLCLCSIDEILTIVQARQDVSPHIAQRLFTALARDSHIGRLESMSAVFDCSTLAADCRSLYLAFREQFRRGTEIDLVAILRQALHDDGQDLEEVNRLEVLSFLDTLPSLTGRYLQLRKEIQEALIVTIRDSVVAGDRKASEKARNELGDVDDIVEEAIRRLPRASASIIEYRHKLQAKRFIEEFDARLERWCSEVTVSRRQSWKPLCEAIRNILARRERNAQCQILVGELENILRSQTSSNPFVNFEDRCEIDAAGRTLVSVPWDIEPGMINTWPASRRQSKLELCTLIADEINCGLIPREEREEYAAKEYAENLDFVSVRELLGDLKSGAAEHFKNEIESRRLQIRQRHSDILKCADALQTERNDISQALLEFESLLDEARLQEAEEWMLVIEDSIRLHKEAQDPERVDIIDRLAALEFDGTSYSLLELRNEWKTAQDAYLNQRLHIDAILRSANATGFPEWLQSSWVELVATLDHPRFWPSAENSYYLQETIPLISRYITGKNRHLDDSTRRHIESVSNCVMAVLRGLMKPESTLATSVLAELEHMIREMHPERAIAAFIAKQSADTFDETASLKVVLPEKRVIVTESQRLPRTNMTLTQVAKDDFKQQTRQFILQWRETLVDLIKRDSAIRAVSRDALGKLIEKRSWLLARRAVAEFLVAEHERLPEQITEYEATYAICCLMTDYFGSPEALKQCCIVAASVPAPFGISTVHVIPRVLIFALGVEADSERVRDEDLGAAVGKSLNTFAKMGRQEIPWRWCHSLLVSADRLRCNAICPTTQIIDDIWDVLKSVTETVEFRRDLLTVLFGMQRRELLLHLTKRLDARLSGPASRLVNSFISIDHESDEDSKKQVIQSVFLFESSQGGARNTRPWGAFFKQQLHRIVQAKDEIPIQIRLESDKLYIDDVGNVLLEFVLSPLGAATVESLTLHLGGIENDNQSAHEEVLVEASDPLQTECARRVQFPATLLVPEGTNMLVAYRFLGHERYSNEEFSLSGRWQVKLAQNRPSPLDDNELQLGWPGAQGKTVRSGTGFYGRKKELGDLDAWLIRSPTPQSVMIFGQRRIGKSSLLEEQVSSMPAVKGHMCGIYCSIDAMPVDGDLGVEFFRQVVQSLSASNINESVREKIQGKVDRLLDVDRLTRVCRPEIKIAEAFEKLLDVLTDGTNRVVERVAFFIDEFDRFVKPALEKRGDEVDRFLWGLRGLMNSSKRIAFVLAGSGLARIFVNDQRQAFWESVAQMELGSFKWPSERDAIADTLLPQRFRDRICERSRFDSVVERGYQITGGVPYYLAMLGYSLARVQHQVTPATLTTVMDKMVNGTVGGRWEINAKSFYSFAFLTLSALPRISELLSKYLLAKLASLVPPEWQSVRVEELLEAAKADFPAIDNEVWEETLHRLDIDFTKMDRERDTVGISLPLMHAALRVDAAEIQADVRRKLNRLLQENSNA